MHRLPSRYIPCDGRLTASAYFDPRSPHGERRGWFRSNTAAVHFNPRSPQGSDNRPPYYALYYIIFQPTLPAWGATLTPISCKRLKTISIHAPRMGSDRDNIRTWFFVYISIHAPRMGSDLSEASYRLYIRIFQSTLPAWGATCVFRCSVYGAVISIHAPRMGSDFLNRGRCYVQDNFNPRSPHGERQPRLASCSSSHYFNPRSPHGERRCFVSCCRAQLCDFNPRSPHVERRAHFISI